MDNNSTLVAQFYTKFTLKYCYGPVSGEHKATISPVLMFLIEENTSRYLSLRKRRTKVDLDKKHRKKNRKTMCVCFPVMEKNIYLLRDEMEINWI